MARRLLPDVSLALQTTATAAGKDAGLRAAALEALALLTFAAEEDGLVTDCIMRGLLKIAAGEREAFFPQHAAGTRRAQMLELLPSRWTSGACSRAHRKAGGLAAMWPAPLAEATNSPG